MKKDLLVEGQRWLSVAEPELGLGIVVKVEKNAVLLAFPATDNERRYGINSHPLKRVKFAIGDEIKDLDGTKLIVEEVKEDKGVLFYKVEGGLLPECDLHDHTTFNNPQERLQLAQVDDNELYQLRQQALVNRQWLMGHASRGFAGAKISLLPHQFSVAGKICDMPRPRALLSDEVGLGKTIESCLVLHHLISTEQVGKVVIVVPDALVYQWFFELYRKFQLTFTVINQESYREKESQPFAESNFVITSTGFLRGSELAKQYFQEVKWDLAIIDEAHHLKWSQEEGASFEYELVENLASVVDGLLLLTATPQQLGLESHFARLRLIDPLRFNNFEEFKKEMESQKEWGDFAFELLNGKEANEKLLAQVDPQGTKSKEEVAQTVIDLHGPGRVTFRNTRDQLKDIEPELFSTRNLEQYELEGSDEFFTKASWLVDFLATDEVKNKKCLLICKLKKTVIELDHFLRSNSTQLKWAQFHSDMSLTERDRQAAYFSQNDGARLLLCTEIGSEGRNFEFSSELVLFDLPKHPDLLEQRIGRLDRIGQENEITIHVPYLKNSEEERLFEWYHEGMDAFLSQVQAGEEVLSELTEEFNEYLGLGEKNSEIIKKVKSVNSKWRKTLAEGRDKLVELNSFDSKNSFELIEWVKDSTENAKLYSFLDNIFSQFGVDFEDLSDNDDGEIFLVRPSYNMYVPAFPHLPADGMRITFSRQLATRREDVHYMTWDHPLVNGAIEMILSQGFGNVTVARRKKTGPVKVFIEASYTWQIVAPKNLNPNRFCPPQKIRVLISEGGDNLTDKWDSETLWSRLRPASAMEVNKVSQYPKEKVLNLLNQGEQIALGKLSEVQKEMKQQIEKHFEKELSRLESLKNLGFKADHIQAEQDILSKQKVLLLDAIGRDGLQLDSFSFIY